MGPFWGDFGYFGPFFWVDRRSPCGHSGIILASRWHHLGLVLVLFWPHFEAFLGPFWATFRPFQPIFSRFWWGLFLRLFGGVLRSWLQNDAKWSKRMQNIQISAKFHQKYAKLCKNKPFSVIKHLFCLKKRSESTLQPMKVCSKWVCL